MPKKRDQTPAPDRAEFVARLLKCVGGPGAAKRQFAIKAGILPSTFNNYFKSVEPDRHTLIKIARAAGEPVGWLVDGSTSSSPQRVMSAEATLSDAELAQLRRNIAYYLRKPKPSLSSRTGISEQRLKDISRIAIPTNGEMDELDRFWPKEVWIREDLENFDQTAFAHAEVKAKIGDGAMVELTPRAKEIGEKLAAELIMMAGTSDISWFRPKDELMAPTVRQDALAIALHRGQITGSGVYLFKNQKREFVARVTVAPDNRVLLTYDNSEHQKIGPSEYFPERYQCIGPIVVIAASPKNPSE